MSSPASCCTRLLGPVGGEHQHHQDRRLQVLGRAAAAVEPADQPAARAAEQQRHRHRGAERRQRGAQAAARDREVLEGQHRHQHADGVVDDALPLEQRGGLLVQARLAQQRQDHRGAGHDQDRRQHDRHRPAQAADVVRRDAAEQPGQRRRDHREAADAAAHALELADLQVHAAFEQDDGDAEPDQLAQLLAPDAGLDDARDGPEQQPDGDQDHDRGQADLRGQPLAREAGAQDDEEQGGGVHVREAKNSV
ncbi:hypothetical protein M2165_004020 [Variovorax sp. TBS-050B]|uniref:hypothetical protein n=1 Tax=Variovorax sp. TBS-050B TaxID=2940551 RepID=UPI002476747D|nr:hypothetical protein [Variovorax sp. TBS-050B]MDH6594131.1 hypothetical protein [Variovorax sp. TBS-050B]